jgi:citrate lyase subunit beta/citryl-CoA lyase
MCSTPRSLLFIPASRPDFVDKARLRGADAIILDLEDGVTPPDKPGARQALTGLYANLRAQGLPVWVRVNGQDGGGDDLDAVAALPDSPMIMLPKIESPSQVITACARLQARGAQPRITPLIETPSGVIRAADIAAAHPCVRGLAFGSEDFAAALGVPPVEAALAAPAQWVVLAAAARGLPAFGLPGSLTPYEDPERLEHLGRLSATLGFSGALCIHPNQVAVLNRCFSPTMQDIAWASRILDHAATHNGGATALDGAMVDAPVMARAQRILDRARP